MSTLPTPETLRSRAAVALARADSATDAGRHSTDAARILAETQRSAALAAYARELLTIADAQTPALVTAPAEVSPPDEYPRVGSVYRHSVSGNVWVAVYVSGVSGDVYLAPSTTLPAAAWTVSPDYLAANFARVPS